MLTHYKKIIDLFKIAIKNILYLYYLYEVNYLNKNTHALTAMFINYLVDLYSCDKIYVLHHLAVLTAISSQYFLNQYYTIFLRVNITMINCEFSTIFLNNYFMLSYIKKNNVIIVNKKVTELFITRYYDKVVLLHKWLIVILFLKLRAYDYLTKIILNKHVYVIGSSCYEEGTCIQYIPWYFGIYTIYGLHLFWTYEVIAKFVFGRIKNKQQTQKIQ